MEEQERTSDNELLRELTKMEQLDKWLEHLIYPGQIKNFIHEDSGSGNPQEVKRSFSFFTDNHEYFIDAIERFDGSDGYLGCQVSARKFRAGENWVRGNDLPDGPFTEQTWNNILNAIIRYELVILSEYGEPDQVPLVPKPNGPINSNGIRP